MSRGTLTTWVAAVAAAVVAACGAAVAVLSLSAYGGSASSSPEVVDVPSGSDVQAAPTGAWVLDVAQSDLEFPRESTATMLVGDDGTLSGTSPCNDWAGQADVAADGSWSLRWLMVNDGGCHGGTGDAQDTFFVALRAATSWDRTGDGTLVLAGGPDALTFLADEPLDTDVLIGTTWEVVTIETSGESRPVPGGVPTSTLTYTGDASGGTFTQHTGCREATGDWVAHGGRVVHTAWSQAGDTDVFEDCSEDQVATEQAVQAAVAGGFRLEIGDDRVVFRSARDPRNAITLQPAGSGRGDAPPEESVGDGIAAELAGSLSPEKAAAAAEGVSAFGFDLHREVAEPGANTVTSPLSASVLLAMVAAGAGGDTAEEMVELLRLEDARDTRYAALLADLTGQSDVTLSIANSLWAAQGYPLADDYVDFARGSFGATLDEVDLGSQETADRIDDWVAERTEGLIEEMAADLGLPDPQAVLVLLNAVYFLGTWTTTFDEAATREAPFQLADGSRVEVPTMHRTDPQIQTSAGDGFTMARLPYGEDERFGMEVLLPDENVPLDDLLTRLDLAVWQQAVDALAASKPSLLALPRFELEWDAELNDALQALGMTSAFGGSGHDFTPMSPANPWLDTVVQNTYVRVDEEGTEAAAVTGGVMSDSPGPPPPFLVDRPFAFTVSDRKTGTILFLGSVHDPRG